MFLIYYWCFQTGSWRELQDHEYTDLALAVGAATQLHRSNPRRVFAVVDDVGSVHASIPYGQAGITAGHTSFL